LRLPVEACTRQQNKTNQQQLTQAAADHSEPPWLTPIITPDTESARAWQGGLR
jgi:hypothetical protein